MLTDELALKLRLAVTAACAERDARIAELEQDNESLRNQNTELDKKLVELEKERAQLETYWNQCLANCKNIAELERQLAEARNQALEDALAEVEQGIWFDKTTDQILDSIAAAIRAMKKEQT